MQHLDWVSVDDLDVAVRIWHPDAPRTLIAWHGLARHGGDFADLAQRLGPEWRVLAPDTPGRGLSTWSLHPERDYTYAAYAGVARAILDHFDLERVPWLGTSMGGLLGLRLAAEPGTAGRIERLILNDIGPELAPEGLAELGDYFSRPHEFASFRELEAELRRHYAGFGIEGDDSWRRLALESARRLPDGRWSFHYDPQITAQFVHDTPRDLWADWGALTCPLMVVRGAHSPLLAAATLERMAETQPQLITLEAVGCGHAPYLDRASQVESIRHFLDNPER
ncbi:alpha/beta fold hydrolase [Halomonas icarae]|uniref:Alpha/beta fold hydrolase n=1 Tax=Halomonas icarae TaxID=2691040 RepID=A0A7X5AKH3_9GAMM|nr:alpha/beta fold hydrolase [Halomonas icarae]MDR5901020.1 alpha/beta fold hydrolase [Halomonas icarae]NAW11295.1 alpha/beta fold hydrolase [Halomonas icarae]